MRRTLSRAAAVAGLILGSAVLAQQQPQVLLPQPRITATFPMGAKIGTALEVTVTGTDLDDATGLVFSHPGIKGEPVAVPAMPVDPKAKPDPNKGGMKKKGAPLASAKFTVKVAADVPAGQYDLRVVNKFGVSNPRAFVVGERVETDELEPNNDVGEPSFREPGAGLVGGPMTVPGANTPRAQRIELGTTVNGVIATPTDVDYTVFQGKANQRVLVSCLTSSIDSRARPLVEVYDFAGRRLGQSRNYAGNDALADVTLPADGDYFVRVSEFAYQQGGPDYFYRLTVGAGPRIDAVFPPMVSASKPTQVTLFGRGLPGGQPVKGMDVDGRPVESLTVTVTPPTDPAARTKLTYRGRVAPPGGLMDGFEYRLPGSNSVPIFLTDATILIEKDAGNDKLETPEAIAVPCEVAGRIDRRYDRDFYSFAAKKGEVFYIQAIAEQIGGVSDLYLRIRNDKGNDLAGELDDDPEALHPSSFFTRSGDPAAYKFTAGADGTFVVLVGSLDANVSYGPRCGYRLRVLKPAPDFRAIVMARDKQMPSAVTIRPDSDVAYDVFVSRTDGFTGPVSVTATNLPAGITAKPALIGTSQKWGSLVLSADATAKEFTGPISVTCTATVDGKPLVREARPASITWGIPAQQNVATVARLDQQVVLAVRPDKSGFRLTTDLAGITLKTKDKDGKDKDEKVAGPIFAKPGDKVTVPVKLAWNEKDARAAPVNVGAEPTQQNMQNAPITVANPTPIAVGKTDGTVTIEVKANATPGTYSVALKADTLIDYLRDPDQKDKKTKVSVLGYAQPISITVLPASLGKFSAQPASNSVKVGGTVDVLVKVERLNDFDGEYQLTLELPKDLKGVTAKTVTLPKGKDEIAIPVTIAADVKPGQLQNLLVVATGTVHAKFPIRHEAKFNLTVAKDK